MKAPCAESMARVEALRTEAEAMVTPSVSTLVGVGVVESVVANACIHPDCPLSCFGFSSGSAGERFRFPTGSWAFMVPRPQEALLATPPTAGPRPIAAGPTAGAKPWDLSDVSSLSFSHSFAS